MANVTFEDSARTDPRFIVLGKLLGTSRFDARGRVLEVWSFCTDECTYFVRPEVLDAVADRDNFGEFMVSAGLAESTSEGTFRIRGTKGRVEWLKKLRKNAKKGGEANRARLAARGKPAGKPPGYPGGYPSGSPEGYPSGQPSYSDPDSDPDSSSQKADPECQAAPDAPLLFSIPASPKPDLARAQTASFLEWFNRRFQRQFTLTTDLVRMVKALNARGYVEKPDIRGVALYLRDEWQDDPKMSKFLKPDSILVASKFGVRIDLAKERYPDIWAPSEASEEDGNAA